jgi:uncharacterized protein YndB with AHSA1/START domain
MSLSHIAELKNRNEVCIVKQSSSININNMETATPTTITIETTVNAPMDKVWDAWTKPEHITQWSFASDDWHTPWAKNDLREGGRFSSRMEAKDGSMGFEFGGVYNKITTNKQIAYTMEDGRKVDIQFTSEGNNIKVVQSFEAETQNSVEMQRSGWQAILDNFKKYAEQL